MRDKYMHVSVTPLSETFAKNPHGLKKKLQKSTTSIRQSS